MATKEELAEFNDFIKGSIPAKTYRAYIDGLHEWGWITPVFYDMTAADKLISDAFDWTIIDEGNFSWETMHNLWLRVLSDFRLGYGSRKFMPAVSACNSIW